jgi:GT2 family glycosyltransferase
MVDELIIVDQSQSRSSIDAGSLPLKHIYNPRITGLCQARNEGMKQATGNIWLFLDDDVLLEPDFIQNLLAAYRPDVTGVSGVVTNYSPPPIFRRLWEFLFEVGPFRDDRQSVYRNAENLRNSPPLQVRKLGGGLMSFRADKIRGLRFDENLSGACFGEDIDFCAGLRRDSVLLIAPQARLVHKRNPEGRSQVHWLDLHSQGTNYMRQRHWRSGFRNNLCFAWLNVGYALAATLSTLKRRSLDPWRAWQSGAQRGAGLAAGRRQV